MAPATNLKLRADQELAALRAELEDLPDVVHAWDAMPDGERASFSLDWDHLMLSYLSELRDLDRQGDLDGEQRQRLAEIVQRIRAATPLAHKLGLYLPSLD